MPSPLDITPSDASLVFKEPASEEDPRVPTAPEMSMAHQISMLFSLQGREKEGWLKYPKITTANQRTLQIADGVAYLRNHPLYKVPINTEITLPAIPGSGLSRLEDHLSVVGLVVEVGATQDPVLGQFTFQYLAGQEPALTIETITKENTRRLRTLWMVVRSASKLNASDLEAMLIVEPNGKYLTVSNVTANGFSVGGLDLYAVDPYWALAKYRVLPAMTAIVPLCRVIRMRDFNDQGYTWGVSSESPMDGRFTIIPAATTVYGDLYESLRNAFSRLISGTPGPGKTYRRTVQNLVAGSVAGNPGREGVTAASPNGSTLLANDQRSLFVNESRVQTLYCQPVLAANDGSGRPMVSISLATQVPLGTTFSQNKGDHKIWTTSGKEESDLGTWVNLGGSGTLTWIGDNNTSIKPNQTVIIQPGIRYPAGSGMNLPFDEVEMAWINSTLISPENILRGGTTDIDAYQNPAKGELFMLVTAPERAGILYLYKKVQVTSDVSGIAIAPADDLGCFAFIAGVAGRIDKPIVTGLQPSTTYDALVYRVFKSTETMQLQLRYCDYQGTQEESFLDGATVMTAPIFFAHTQGGGGSVFMGDASFRYSPISMHLPASPGGEKAFRMRGPVWLQGEQNAGPIRFREMSMLAGAGLVLPQPGQKITIDNLSGIQARSMTLKLKVNGELIGFRAPELVGKELYQACAAFVVAKEGSYRMVVLTSIGTGGKDIAADTSTNTAIDTFAL